MTAALVEIFWPQLRRASRGHHPRHRRHLRPGARPPAALAVQRPLRHSLLPVGPRLSCRERQAGGGSPAPGQGRRRAPRSAPSSSTWSAASAGTGRAPGSPSGETATTAGPRPWRGARRTASTTSSAWRAIPCCTASHTASPTTSGCAAPRPAPKRCGASPPSTTPPVRGADRCARRSLPGRWQPSPLFGRVGLRDARFEACSTFTRVAAHMVAKPPKAARCTGVLQPKSLPPSTAPIATGWSDSCRAGLESRRGKAPFHGAPNRSG